MKALKSNGDTKDDDVTELSPGVSSSLEESWARFDVGRAEAGAGVGAETDEKEDWTGRNEVAPT